MTGRGPSAVAPGSRAVAVGLAIAALACASAAWQRPVRLDDEGRPRDGAVSVLPTVRIDPNRADPAELSLLPGFGPELARRVALDRAAHGPYRGLEDLARVSGVGPVRLRHAAPHLVFDVRIDDDAPGGAETRHDE